MIRFFLISTVTLAWGFIYSSGASISESNGTYYPEQLPGRFSGGFGEETCHSCHFDYPLNYEEGFLRVKGLPERYEAGNSYQLEVVVGRPELVKAGFQLTARFPDSTQAGTFRLRSDRVLIAEFDSVNVQYVQHAEDGTDTSGVNQTVWSLDWTAPLGRRSDVLFHVAANAANGDASEFGDYILAREIRIPSHR
ncbi:MAG: choice-of-anchor V domain-containing protein [Balneolaceae bacterium]|nr:choice-of-anchor V domain-containing protein [Balneolaceae bacterium]